MSFGERVKGGFWSIYARLAGRSTEPNADGTGGTSNQSPQVNAEPVRSGPKSQAQKEFKTAVHAPGLELTPDEQKELEAFQVLIGELEKTESGRIALAAFRQEMTAIERASAHGLRPHKLGYNRLAEKLQIRNDVVYKPKKHIRVTYTFKPFGNLAKETIRMPSDSKLKKVLEEICSGVAQKIMKVFPYEIPNVAAFRDLPKGEASIIKHFVLDMSGLFKKFQSSQNYLQLRVLQAAKDYAKELLKGKENIEIKW